MLPSLLMALFRPLLLQSTMPSPSVPPWLLFALALAGFGFGVFSWWRRESREDRTARHAQEEKRFAELEAAMGAFVDKDALEKRFSGIESKHAIVAVEVANQHNTLHEYERERERLKGEFAGQVKQLQKDVLTLEPMPGRVQNLEAKFDTLNERITNLKEGVVELKNGQRENKNEIIEAIKQHYARP